MHEVKAFIRPELLDRVVQALHAIAGLPGLTTSTVRGHGHVTVGLPRMLSMVRSPW